jgi:hypothetical protein
VSYSLKKSAKIVNIAISTLFLKNVGLEEYPEGYIDIEGSY